MLYFSAPTRGEQLRLLFKVAKQPLEDVRLAFPAGLVQFKHSTLGDDSPLLFDQCPTVTSPDGVHVSQVAAAMQFAGRRLKLAPADDAADARALSLTLFSEEIRINVFYKLLIPAVVCAFLRRKFCGILCCCAFLVNLVFRTSKVRRSLRPKLELLESALRGSGGDYFCGSALCYADVALVDCVRESLAMPGFNRAEELRDFPKLAAFLSRMENHPELQGYFVERGPAVEAVINMVVK